MPPAAAATHRITDAHVRGGHSPCVRGIKGERCCHQIDMRPGGQALDGSPLFECVSYQSAVLEVAADMLTTCQGL